MMTLDDIVRKAVAENENGAVLSPIWEEKTEWCGCVSRWIPVGTVSGRTVWVFRVYEDESTDEVGESNTFAVENPGGNPIRYRAGEEARDLYISLAYTPDEQRAMALKSAFRAGELWMFDELAENETEWEGLSITEFHQAIANAVTPVFGTQEENGAFADGAEAEYRDHFKVD